MYLLYSFKMHMLPAYLLHGDSSRYTSRDSFRRTMIYARYLATFSGGWCTTYLSIRAIKFLSASSYLVHTQ